MTIKPLVLPFKPDGFTRYARAHLLMRSLGVSASTISRWCRAGALPGAKRQGRIWLVPLEVFHAIKLGEFSVDATGVSKVDRPAT